MVSVWLRASWWDEDKGYGYQWENGDNAQNISSVGGYTNKLQEGLELTKLSIIKVNK